MIDLKGETTMRVFAGWNVKAALKGDCAVCGNHHRSGEEAKPCSDAVLRHFGPGNAARDSLRAAKSLPRQCVVCSHPLTTWDTNTCSNSCMYEHSAKDAGRKIDATVLGNERREKKVLDRVQLVDHAADRALRFLSGLNLQDHAVAEQRESLEIVRELMAALRPGKSAK